MFLVLGNIVDRDTISYTKSPWVVAVFALSYTGQKILTWDAPDGTTTRSNTPHAEQAPGNTLPGNFKIRVEISSVYAHV